jgi:cytochrome c553
MNPALVLFVLPMSYLPAASTTEGANASNPDKLQAMWTNACNSCHCEMIEQNEKQLETHGNLACL